MSLTYRRVFRTMILLVGGSLIITLFTLLVPQTATSREEYAALQYGLPFHFVTQNLLWFNPPPPQTFIITTPQSEPTDFSSVPFLLSWLVNFLILTFVVILVKKMKDRKPGNQSMQV